MRCKALKPTSDSRLQDFLGTLQSFEAYTPKIPGQGYFIFPEIPGVHVNSTIAQHWQASSSRLPSSRVMLPAYAGPCLGSRPVAWLDGMVEILVSDNREG